MRKKLMRPTSNDEAIAQLMDLSKNGPLVQAFVIDSLSKFGETVGNMSDEQAVQQFGEVSLINPIAWRDAARTVRDTLNKHFAGELLVPDEEDEEDDE